MEGHDICSATWSAFDGRSEVGGRGSYLYKGTLRPRVKCSCLNTFASWCSPSTVELRASFRLALISREQHQRFRMGLLPSFLKKANLTLMSQISEVQEASTTWILVFTHVRRDFPSKKKGKHLGVPTFVWMNWGLSSISLDPWKQLA